MPAKDLPTHSKGTWQQRWLVTAPVTVAIVIGQWLLAFGSILSYLLVVLLLAGIAWTVRSRRWAALAAILAASPLTVSFARGVGAYWTPDAYMMAVGLMSSERSFVHPTTRLPIATSGCLVDGDEWVRNSPYNAALILLSTVAGPPPGTYDGPLPNEAEAREALERADDVAWRAMARDRVDVGRRRVRLQRLLGPALMDSVFYFDPLDQDEELSRAPEDGMIRARIWQERVLLIELRDFMAFEFDDVPSHVSVVDAESGRLLGHFPGAYNRMGMPLAWRSVGPRILDMDYAEGPPSLSP